MNKFFFCCNKIDLYIHELLDRHETYIQFFRNSFHTFALCILTPNQFFACFTDLFLCKTCISRVQVFTLIKEKKSSEPPPKPPPILTKILNTSLERDCFPNQLKLAEVTPVFKKEDELNKENYHLVSVLPTHPRYLKE